MNDEAMQGPTLVSAFSRRELQRFRLQVIMTLAGMERPDMAAEPAVQRTFFKAHEVVSLPTLSSSPLNVAGTNGVVVEFDVIWTGDGAAYTRIGNRIEPIVDYVPRLSSVGEILSWLAQRDLAVTVEDLTSYSRAGGGVDSDVVSVFRTAQLALASVERKRSAPIEGTVTLKFQGVELGPLQNVSVDLGDALDPDDNRE